MRLFFSLWLLLLGSSSYAADIVTQIASRLSTAPVVSGQFEQQKTLTGFSKPLISSGEFLLWKTHGVWWQTHKPFASTLRITRHTLQAWQGDNSAQKTLAMDAKREPALKALNGLLFAIFSGDFKTLEKSFKLAGQLQGKQLWRIHLVPTDPVLLKVIRSATLEGDQYVRSLVLKDANDDTSLIRFIQIREAQKPSTAEASRFVE